jgi:hypothetical protein
MFLVVFCLSIQNEGLVPEQTPLLIFKQKTAATTRAIFFWFHHRHENPYRR